MRGTIGHQPWGSTLAAIGLGGNTGQLVVRTEGAPQTFRIAFVNGVVAGASSPVSADSIARVALAMKLIAPAHAKALSRCDSVERFAAVTGLGGTTLRELEKRLLVQRVARTFGVDAGTFVLEERVTIPVVVGIEVDVRAAIYTGMRTVLSAQRLARTLRTLGSRFVLRDEALEQLPRFGFTEAEQPVLDALRAGVSLPELEATRRDLDPRMAEAVVCTLAVCGALDAITLPRTPTPHEPTVSRVPTPREPAVTRTSTPREPTWSCVPMLIRQDPEVTLAPKPRASGSTPPFPPTVPPTSARAMTDPFLEVQPTRLRPPALTAAEVRRVIALGTRLLETGVDHFTFLGLSFGASFEEVRDAYLEFARYLQPERLADLGIADDDHQARAVFTRVVIAFTVLTDPVRRAAYLAAHPEPPA